MFDEQPNIFIRESVYQTNQALFSKPLTYSLVPTMVGNHILALAAWEPSRKDANLQRMGRRLTWFAYWTNKSQCGMLHFFLEQH